MIKPIINFSIIINLPIILNLILLILTLIPRKFNKPHPLNIIIILIFTTTLITININIIYKSWINYITFLTIIGGLIIIFIYITSIANNEFFLIKLKNILINLIKFLPFILICLLLINLLSNEIFYNPQDLWNKNFNIIEEKNELNISNLYNFNKYILLFIINYLFFSIICIINICYKFKRPLRQLYFYE